jgi:hypothetical protein
LRPEWDDPPAPVSGAPWGSTNFGVVVGTNEVTGNGVVVVVDFDPGAFVVEPDPGAVVVDVTDDDGVDVVVVDVDDANVVDVVDAPDDEVVVVVGGGGVARQLDAVIVLSFSVTAPLIASTRPLTVAPLSSVIDVAARIVPTKLVVEPNVAELPTSQKTLHACAPFSSTTDADEAVVSVEPAWKMKTESASPPPSRVTAPVRPMLDVD